MGKIKDITEFEKCYLAGFFDGDGCVSIVKSNKPPYGYYYQLAVMFSQSDKSFLEYWQEKTGVGKVYKQNGKTKLKRNKDHYIWRVPSRLGGLLLKQIYPYLIIKKDQAKTALGFQKTKKQNGKRSEDLIEYRKSLYLRLREQK